MEKFVYFLEGSNFVESFKIRKLWIRISDGFMHMYFPPCCYWFGFDGKIQNLSYTNLIGYGSLKIYLWVVTASGEITNDGHFCHDILVGHSSKRDHKFVSFSSKNIERQFSKENLPTFFFFLSKVFFPSLAQKKGR